jgi:hypothetical protein
MKNPALEPGFFISRRVTAAEKRVRRALLSAVIPGKRREAPSSHLISRHLRGAAPRSLT